MRGVGAIRDVRLGPSSEVGRGLITCGAIRQVNVFCLKAQRACSRAGAGHPDPDKRELVHVLAASGKPDRGLRASGLGACARKRLQTLRWPCELQTFATAGNGGFCSLYFSW